MTVAGFAPLAALGATAFAALVWGALGLVLAVFGYLLASFAREFAGDA